MNNIHRILQNNFRSSKRSKTHFMNQALLFIFYNVDTVFKVLFYTVVKMMPVSDGHSLYTE